MSNYAITEIKGVIPAMFTTFDEQENVDLARARTLVEFLIGQGVHGLYITGSTGEGFLMTNEERKVFTKAVVEVVAGRIPVVVHVGDIGTRQAIDLAKHAERVGADAVSSVPPFYYKFNPEDIYNYYKDISESVSIPMIIYNISLAGLMSNTLVKRIASLPNVKGLKFTGREHDDMCALKEDLGRDFMVYSGCDEMATQGLLAGADGLIGSFYNLLPDTTLAIYEHARKGEYVEAFEIQKVATRFIHFAVQWDFFPILKQLLREAGVDAGYSRRPFAAPSEATMDTVHAYCKEMKLKHGATVPLGFLSRT
jgi:N-acetylneuraminate lyase